MAVFQQLYAHFINGAGILRVHDVKQTVEALKIAAAIKRATYKMYKIFVKNLKLFGYHGVNPEEKINGQDFIFNAAIHLKEDCEKPDIALSDDISNTVNYSEIITVIKDVNSAKKFDLLETLSKQIAQNILDFSPLISKVKVKVEKPNPPIKEDT